MAGDIKEFFDEVKEIYLSHKTVRLGQAIWLSYNEEFRRKYYLTELDVFYNNTNILGSLKAYFKLCLSDESEPMLNKYLNELKQLKCSQQS